MTSPLLVSELVYTAGELIYRSLNPFVRWLTRFHRLLGCGKPQSHEDLPQESREVRCRGITTVALFQYMSCYRFPEILTCACHKGCVVCPSLCAPNICFQSVA